MSDTYPSNSDKDDQDDRIADPPRIGAAASGSSAALAPAAASAEEPALPEPAEQTDVADAILEADEIVDEIADETADDDRLAAAEDEDAEDEEEDEEPAGPRSRLLLLGVAGVLLVAAGVSLGLLFARWSQPPGDDQVIARVGPTAITRGEFLRRYQPGSDPKELLDQLIEAELIVQASSREGTKVDSAAVDQQVQQIRQQQGDEEKLKLFLQSKGIADEAALRDLLGRDQLIQAMVFKHTTLEQAHARHILLGGQDPDAIAKRKAEAEALFKQLQDGGDFAALAKEKSDDPGSKESGGDLGWAPRGAFVPAFDEALFSMKPGELRLVQTDYGWHIIQLADVPAVRPLEDRRYFSVPAVQQAISETFLPWIKSLRADAEKASQVTVVVPPTELVPSPGPSTLPTALPVQ